MVLYRQISYPLQESRTVQIKDKEGEQSDKVKLTEAESGKAQLTEKDSSKTKSKGKLSAKISTTSETLDKSECCPFNFHIKWNNENCRWYLPREQKGNSSHVGHLKRQTDITHARDLKFPDGINLWLPVVHGKFSQT